MEGVGRRLLGNGRRSGGLLPYRRNGGGRCRYRHDLAAAGALGSPAGLGVRRLQFLLAMGTLEVEHGPSPKAPAAMLRSVLAESRVHQQFPGHLATGRRFSLSPTAYNAGE